MNLTELQAEIVTITNRPDLIAETLLAVRKATARLHSLEYFPRDLVEVNVSMPVAAFVGQIDITQAPFVRYRSAKYLREYTNPHSVVARYFEPVEIDLALDSYAVERTNIWYPVGGAINWKAGWSNSAQNGISGMTVGYYQNPDVSVVGYNSWIADNEPWAIIEEAAANILAMTGQADLANQVRASAMDNRQQLIQNYLEGSAR